MAAPDKGNVPAVKDDNQSATSNPIEIGPSMIAGVVIGIVATVLLPKLATKFKSA